MSDQSPKLSKESPKVYILIANMIKSWYDTIQVVCVTYDIHTFCEKFKRHAAEIVEDYIENDDYGSDNEEFIRNDVRLDDLAKQLIGDGECVFSIGDDDFHYTLERRSIE
jgi:hypothetical protein